MPTERRGGLFIARACLRGHLRSQARRGIGQEQEGEQHVRSDPPAPGLRGFGTRPGEPSRRCLPPLPGEVRGRETFWNICCRKTSMPEMCFSPPVIGAWYECRPPALAIVA